jgi:hypothetical protein
MNQKRTRVVLPQATKDMIVNLLNSGLGPSAVVKAMPGIKVGQVWPFSSKMYRDSKVRQAPTAGKTTTTDAAVKKEATVVKAVVKATETICYSVDGVDIILSKKPNTVTIADNVISFKF